MTAPLPIVKPRALELDPRTYERGLSCVHCGLCLPACPTYTQSGYEADSPRGRIQLMLGLAEGAIDATTSVRHHLDLCLDCRACETACPSGVVYHELIEETRTRLARTAKPTLQDRLMRWIFFHIFTRPTRLKLALLPARLMQKIGFYGLLRRSGIFRLLPMQLRKMEQMLPATGALWPRRLRAANCNPHPNPPPEYRGREKEGASIAFFEGCIGSVLFDQVNRQSMELLSASSSSVAVPRRQACCGAIHHHNGAHDAAQKLARRNIDAFCPVDGPDPTHIVTNIAGCGAMLREYDLLLRDDPAYAARAKDFVSRVRDVSEVLAQIGLPRLKHPIDAIATYHDACHLAHAQKVVSPPRQLLLKVPGLKLVPLPESDVCCGAAGTYNLTQPRMATELARRKLVNIAATGAKVCITGNVGCAMQIQSEAVAAGMDLRVLHPVQLLHEAAFGRIDQADKDPRGSARKP
jgi:glycolate oxidase iron-sulfur subunit